MTYKISAKEITKFRAMLAFAEFEDLRGRIISEGGTKLCLRLAKEATPEGKIKAAHAIAKLGAKADPQIAFPGQRAYEVVLIPVVHFLEEQFAYGLLCPACKCISGCQTAL